jgi:hypothetical protein
VGGWFIRGRCAYLPRVFPLVPALSADVVVLGFTPPQKETQKGEGEGRLEVGDKQASPCPRHPQGVAVACLNGGGVWWGGWVGGVSWWEVRGGQGNGKEKTRKGMRV